MALNKTLRYIGIASIFLIPFVSLIVTPSLFFPYITGKNFIFRILVEIAFICWATLAFRDPAYRPRWKSPVLVSLVVFMVIIFFADLFGEYFFKSFWSNFERMEGYITFLHLLVLFFVSTILLNSKKLWNRFFHVFLAIGIILGFTGIFQHFRGGVDRIDATLGNSTYLGALMVFNIFLLLLYMMRCMRGKGKNWKWISVGYAVAILFDFYILILTGTRGALLGVVGGFVFIALVFSFSRQASRVAKYSGRILLGLIILALILIVSLQNTSLIKSHQSFSRLTEPIDAVLTGNIKGYAESEAGGGGRLLIWGAALKGFEARPILGWGQENFNYVFNFYYTPAMYAQEQWFDRAHNVLLDWLTQGGILGLLSYLAIFAALLYGIWKKKHNDFSIEDKSVLTGLLIAYFVHNFFVFDNITSYIIFFAIIAYINRIQFEHADVVRKPRVIHPDIANYALAPVAIIIALVAFYFGVFRPYVASASLIQALVDEQSGNITTTFAEFQNALTPHTFGSPEAREQLLLLVPPVGTSATIDANTKQEVISFADDQLNDQIKRTPYDARYFLFYGYALDRLGDPVDLQNANTLLTRASQLSPGKQTILFELGLNDLARGDNTDALTILKRAYDSAPAYDEARITYISALIYAGDYSQASALISTADATVINDDRILQAYYNNKQYLPAIDVYHKRQAASSTNPQNYLGAAGFYLLLNQSNNAILELTKLESILPEYKSQIDSYISQIKAGKNPLPISSQQPA